MTVKFSEFYAGLGSPPTTYPMNTDIIVGLRAGINEQSLFGGVTDSLGANIITWLQGAGPNVNYLSVQNNVTGLAPIISAIGTDTNVNLELLAQGTGHVYAGGTTAFGVPVGTTAQEPPAFLGAIRLDTDIGYFQGSIDGINWIDFAEAGGGITSVLGTTNEITATTVGSTTTLSIPSTFIAPGSITATTNSYANNFIPGYTTTAATGNSVVLTNASTQYQVITGTSTITFTLPDATTLAVGWTFQFNNNSTGNVTINTNGGSLLRLIASGTYAIVTLTTASPAAGVWNIHSLVPSNATWNTGGLTVVGTFRVTSSDTAASFLLDGSTSGVISILPQAIAGTYNFNMPTTAGTSGYVLTSAGGGSSPMTWTNLGSAAVTSIAGTANQITASASTGAVTLSIPSTFIAPGSIAATTTVSGTTFNSSTLTASTALASDGSKNIVSSSTTATELGYVHGVTSAIQTQFTNKITVTSAEIYSADTGAANAYVVTLSPAPSSYTTGLEIHFVAANANTTASTINVNGLGLKNITKYGTTALASGDIALNQMVTVVYDGTQFQLENPVANTGTGTGTVTSVTLATGLTAALAITGTNPITTSGTITLTSHGNLINVQYLTSGTGATYTPTTGTNSILVQMVGGGGGGTTVSCTGSTLGAGGGGGAGGFCQKYITSVASSYTYTIGGGGAANTTGGNTTFGSLTANGGTASGATLIGNAGSTFGSGYAGGSASGGDLNIQGAPGTLGLSIATVNVVSGTGGSTMFGGGGGAAVVQGTVGTADGIAGATNSGGGGSGAAVNDGDATAPGGAGGSGLIVVYEYS